MAPSPERDRQEARLRAWRNGAFAALLLAYFLYCNWEGLRAPFAADDMMNLAEYWRHNPWRLVFGQFMPWHDFYRPMGGLFYVPLFLVFGLNPLPFHAVLLALVLLYVGLTYGLARRLGATELEAWLAALVVAYHAGLANLYYETSHVYDVLCGIFFAAALACYAGARSQRRPLRKGETAAFFLLFLGSLDSKEMAVTLPVMLLAYEWFYQRPRGRGQWTAWLRGVAPLPLAASILTVVYLRARVWGGLAHAGGYGVTWSLTQFAHFQRQEFQDLFFQWNTTAWTAMAVVWLLVTYAAWRRDRPLLRFAWTFILVTPLPVEFLEGRSMAVLAIPLLGWSMLSAVVAIGVARALAGWLAGEPGFRRLHAANRLAVVLAVFIFAWAAWNRGFYESDVRHAMWETNRPTAAVIAQFQALAPRVRPHATVVFLNDPFEGWDMAFIAELWFHDRTVNVRLQKKTPLRADKLAHADYLFDWRGGRLVAAGGAATGSRSPRP